jgi:hypothetical protein
MRTARFKRGVKSWKPTAEGAETAENGCFIISEGFGCSAVKVRLFHGNDGEQKTWTTLRRLHGRGRIPTFQNPCGTYGRR